MPRCCWRRWTRSGSAGGPGCYNPLFVACSIAMGALVVEGRPVHLFLVTPGLLSSSPTLAEDQCLPHAATCHSEELVRTLEAAEREAVAATEKLLKAQAKIEQLKAKAKGKGGKYKGGLPASPSLASLEGGEAVEALQARIAALKASRDKLIGAFDAQAAEIERLSGDNAALAEVGEVEQQAAGGADCKPVGPRDGHQLPAKILGGIECVLPLCCTCTR